MGIGLPVLAFFREASSITYDKLDTDRVPLELFMAQVRDRHLIKQWKTGSDLAHEVTLALNAQIREDERSQRPQPGWYRGSREARDLLAELEFLRKENRRLTGTPIDTQTDPSPLGSLTLTFRDHVNGTQATFWVHHKARIEQLVSHLCNNVFHLPAGDYQLMHQKRIIPHDVSIAEAGLRDGDELHLEKIGLAAGLLARLRRSL